MNKRYAVFPNMAQAQAKSAQAAQQLGCDGVNTRYWWQIIPLNDGSAAVVLDLDDPMFGTDITLKNGKTINLNTAEKAALKTEAQMAGLLPNPAPPGG